MKSSSEEDYEKLRENLENHYKGNNGPLAQMVRASDS